MMKKSGVVLSVMMACLQIANAMEGDYPVERERQMIAELMTVVKNPATGQWGRVEIAEEARLLSSDVLPEGAGYKRLVEDYDLLHKLLVLVYESVWLGKKEAKDLLALLRARLPSYSHERLLGEAACWIELICARLPFKYVPGLISAENMQALVGCCIYGVGGYRLAHALRICVKEMIWPADREMLATLTVPVAGSGTIQELLCAMKERLRPDDMTARGYGAIVVDKRTYRVLSFSEAYERTIRKIITMLDRNAAALYTYSKLSAEEKSTVLGALQVVRR